MLPSSNDCCILPHAHKHWGVHTASYTVDIHIIQKVVVVEHRMVGMIIRALVVVGVVVGDSSSSMRQGCVCNCHLLQQQLLSLLCVLGFVVVEQRRYVDGVWVWVWV